MEKKAISNLDLDLFYEKLENGLEIYIVPKENSNNKYVTFTTKYGSINNSFKIGDEIYNMPPGIAHFLEHKMFEQENGDNPFSLFCNNGAEANAFTNYKQTTYLFSSPNNFEENLEILFNLINNPYFTDENVEKEKGIIIQELKMYEDNHFRKGFNKIIENAFKNHPIKMQVGGTTESVKKITKEDLYKCYETFYNPSNMFIVITGNVDPLKTIEIIKRNVLNKEKINFENIDINEPNEIVKKEEIIKMNVTIPKVYYGIKINIGNLNMRTTKQYISLYLDCLFDSTSDFSSKLKEKGIINEDIGYFLINTSNHILVIFSGETNKTKELLNEINNNLLNVPDEETFNRKKKVSISSIIYSSDNIFRINNIIINSIINNGKFDIQFYEEFKNLNYNEMINTINSLNFDNRLKVIIKKK